jgi:DNA-binding response OmpR family regulator
VVNILVIDDDRAIRLMVERGLHAVGFDVRSASTAEEGLDMVRRSPPDVALVDVYLPEMNGLELYRKLRALDRKLPIIFITADNSSETTIEAM